MLGASPTVERQRVHVPVCVHGGVLTHPKAQTSEREQAAKYVHRRGRKTHEP